MPALGSSTSFAPCSVIPVVAYERTPNVHRRKERTTVPVSPATFGFLEGNRNLFYSHVEKERWKGPCLRTQKMYSFN